MLKFVIFATCLWIFQGASRRVVNMEWNKFGAENRREIDKTAKRFMAIDDKHSVSLKITNYSSGENAFT